jgi:uncharacterized protein (TIGR02594 family)
MTSYNAAVLEAAGQYLGIEEWPGARHNPVIQGMFAAVGHRPDEPDETPWCAAFVGAVLAELGLPHTGRLNARSYLDWGQPVEMRAARPGDVCILWRGQPQGWQGHVGFVVRFDGDRVILRGGNQGNRVSDAGYPVSRILGFRRAVAADGAGRVTLRHGMRGPEVRALQERLADLGYPPGAIDGAFGDRTAAAVLAFQADLGLSTDGVVGRQTWGALDAAPPRPARDVTLPDLRARGSRTVADADQGQQIAGAGGAVAGGAIILSQAEQAVQLVQRSRGTLDAALGLVTVYWPVLLIGGVGWLAWQRFARIKAARLDDARSGRNLGR